MTLPVLRPRRSCLYMPASNARALAKARTVAADALILDLEDAIAPAAKAEARIAACRAVADGGFGGRERIIRINPLDSIWGADDIRAAAQSGADGLLVPKVNRAADMRAIGDAMDAAGAPADMAIWVMIETPLALLHIGEIAASAKGGRLSAFVIGLNDLAKELRAQITPGRMAFQSALQTALIAARAHGLIAIDGVYNDIADLAGFEAECAQGRLLGYDGKSIIHPAQVEICNRAFSPGEEELINAQKIIAAFAAAENAGQGVIKVDGIMAELLHLEQARRIVAIADEIKRLTA